MNGGGEKILFRIALPDEPCAIQRPRVKSAIVLNVTLPTLAKCEDEAPDLPLWKEQEEAKATNQH